MLSPKRDWDLYESHVTPWRRVMLFYVVPMALIPAVGAFFVGRRGFTIDFMELHIGGTGGLWRLLDDPASAATNAAKNDTDAILQEFASHVTAYVHGEKQIAERCRSIEFEHGKLVAASKRPNLKNGGGTCCLSWRGQVFGSM
jgi:hypothetical protein